MERKGVDRRGKEGIGMVFAEWIGEEWRGKEGIQWNGLDRRGEEGTGGERRG